ncbi:MAG: sugar ABC transporter permease [Clostridiales bacterium]|nr:sugar ABC transporter permease [Clostridiales bacterium]
MFKAIKNGNGKVALSTLCMGLGQLCYRQIGKGLLLLLIQISGIAFFVATGGAWLRGFFTLGTIKANPAAGIAGDNSVIMLILGIFAWLLVAVYFFCWRANIKDVYATQLAVEKGEKPSRFGADLQSLFNRNFHKAALFLPLLGVLVFTIIPILFMMLIAFTNYGGEIVPPELVRWTGFESFKRLVTLKEVAPTFGRILSWNFLWAVASTALNYFLGLLLAILYNKKCVRGKAIWRAFPILAYAVPGFITLLAFKFMFSYGGPINQLLTAQGHRAIGFLDLDARWMARGIGLFVNAWISIPSSMLLATGILSNADRGIYEAATIDGASAYKQFTKLTLPYVLFATLPVLITQFIGNFNNFGIFYFLRGGLYMDGYFLASDTDLLINWLYNLSIDQSYYSIGAAISIVIFAITSVISLAVYILSPSYRQEETYR